MAQKNKTKQQQHIIITIFLTARVACILSSFDTDRYWEEASQVPTHFALKESSLLKTLFRPRRLSFLQHNGRRDQKNKNKIAVKDFVLKCPVDFIFSLGSNYPA